MPYKYGKQTREFGGRFYFHFSLVFHDFEGFYNKTIILLALVGYEMIIANSALRTLLAIYHLRSNSRSWNNCQLDVLFCSIAEYFLRVVPYFDEPLGRVKIQTTSKNTQRYFSTKCLIRGLLSNSPNCYVCVG